MLSDATIAVRANAAVALLLPSLVLLLLGPAPSPVHAFTNGTLIPSYLCDLEDLRIGSPASLGGVIPYLVEDGAMAAIAGYHHRASPYTAQDLCTASIATAGQTTVTATTSFVVSTLNATDSLIGLLAWVQDVPATGAPRRIGTITTPGLNMIYYPYRGCGSVGQTIVHSTALDDDAALKNQSAAFTWALGADGVSGTTVQLRGICITRLGFGPFTVSLTAATAVANTYTGGTTGYDGSGSGTCALTTATNAAVSSTSTAAATAAASTTTATTAAATATATSSTATKSVTTLSTKTTTAASGTTTSAAASTTTTTASTSKSSSTTAATTAATASSSSTSTAKTTTSILASAAAKAPTASSCSAMVLHLAVLVATVVLLL
ncbi:hypothetical protein HK405_009921 [Cladochytrium tenue]|nr:hypothetical protein HK405_009921 [Cladochytrium tenue]